MNEKDHPDPGDKTRMFGRPVGYERRHPDPSRDTGRPDSREGGLHGCAFPMSLPLQWQVEAAEMRICPATPGIRQAVYDELKYLEESSRARTWRNRNTRLPQDERFIPC